MKKPTNGQNRIKAVSMLSGGLDSILATCVMLEQGIDVTPLHIQTGLTYDRRNRLTGQLSTQPSHVHNEDIGPPTKKGGGPETGLAAEATGAPSSRPQGSAVTPSRPERAARMLGLDLVDIKAFEQYIPVILNPRHGYGSAMNPCVDCRIFLLRQAKAWMEEHNHHFVFTGEVLGQRPNSQTRPSLKLIERESGLEGLLLRPLSAKLLEPTIPEKRGWVNRERLYGFHGRSRKAQMELARRFDITDYPQPAGGGCFLVDQNYSRRLQDFLDHEGDVALTNQRAFLLSVGRHVRLPSGRKVIVGRHREENAYITTQRDEGVLMTTFDLEGPTTLVTGDPTRQEIEQAARITARYAGAKGEKTVRVEVCHDNLEEIVTVKPLMLEEIHALMV